MNRLDKIKQEFFERFQNKFAEEKVDISVETAFDILVSADPSPNKKNVRWLIETYLDDGYLFEDISAGEHSKVHDTLNIFIRNKNKLDVLDRSINRYQSIADMWKMVKQYAEDKTGKEIKRDDHDRAMAETEVVIDNDNMRVIIPLTEYASKFHGRGTRWCTAADNNNMFSHYAKDAPLFIIINKHDNKKFQFWKNKYKIQFMDIDDIKVSYDYIMDNYDTFKEFIHRYDIFNYKKISEMNVDDKINLLRERNFSSDFHIDSLLDDEFLNNSTFIKFLNKQIKSHNYEHVMSVFYKNNRALKIKDAKTRKKLFDKVFKIDVDNTIPELYLYAGLINEQETINYCIKDIWKNMPEQQYIFGHRFSLSDDMTRKHFFMCYPDFERKLSNIPQKRDVYYFITHILNNARLTKGDSSIHDCNISGNNELNTFISNIQDLFIKHNISITLQDFYTFYGKNFDNSHGEYSSINVNGNTLHVKDDSQEFDCKHSKNSGGVYFKEDDSDYILRHKVEELFLIMEIFTKESNIISPLQYGNLYIGFLNNLSPEIAEKIIKYYLEYMPGLIFNDRFKHPLIQNITDLDENCIFPELKKKFNECGIVFNVENFIKYNIKNYDSITAHKRFRFHYDFLSEAIIQSLYKIVVKSKDEKLKRYLMKKNPWILNILHSHDQNLFYRLFQNSFIIDLYKNNVQATQMSYYAVEQNGMSLQYVSIELRDEKLCKTAIQQNPKSIIHVPCSIREKIAPGLLQKILEG